LRYKAYVTSRDFGGMMVPVPAQNSCIREYVANNNGVYILPNLESSFDNCFHQLFGAIANIIQGDALVMYSLTMLPKGQKLKQFLDMCSLKGITLAFVLENITVSADYSKLINEMETYKLASLELSEADWGELIDIYYQ